MYLTLKAMHIISVIAWFAGLFYIFRLFVYHVANQNSSDCKNMLTVMERKLLAMIMAPAATLTVIFGSAMLWLNPALLSFAWIWVKLVMIILLLAYHALSIYTYRRFANGQWIFTEKQCRMINEVPTLLLLIIVFLAILKPF